DVSPMRATYLALLGMHPQAQDDMFFKNEMVKGEEEAQKAALRDAIKDWRRGIEAANNKDPEQAQAYTRNAMARLTAVGYPPDKIASFMAIANRGWEKAINSSDWNFWSRGDYSKSQERLG